MTSKPLIAATREPLIAQAVAAAPVEQVLRWLDSSADGLSGSHESTFPGRSRRGPTVGNVHNSWPFGGQAPDPLRRMPPFPRWLKPLSSQGTPTGRANRSSK